MQLWRIRDVFSVLAIVVSGAWDIDLVEGKAEDIDEGRVARKTALIEDSMRRNDEFLRSRVPESPGLGALRIADKETLPGVRLHRLAILLAHQDIGKTAKSAEVGDIRFAPIAFPGSPGYSTLQGRCGHAVSRVDEGRDGVAPKRRRELRLNKESSPTLSNRPVCSFCDAVLVRFIWLSVLTLDAMLRAKIDELLAHVLPTLVVACSLQDKSQRVLSVRLEGLEGRESVALALQEGNHPESRSIADEGHPVDMPLRCRRRERALEVGVNQGDADKLSGRKTRDRVSMQLAS